MGFFDFLKRTDKTSQTLDSGMSKTSQTFGDSLASLFLGRKTIDAELLEELEEILITSDMGVAATETILENVRIESSRGALSDPEKLYQAVKNNIRNILAKAEVFNEPIGLPYVILVSGVNGVGKTTSIAKLANMYKQGGKHVMLAAGDTFRAAAADQLCVWGERLGIPVVRQEDGSDPAAVIHDAANSAKSKHVDVLIADTAGRLHTKNNLMNELVKIERVVSKEIEGAPHERLLVLDATNGQNALEQARKFKEAIGINGIILTKLDGTAKGGILVRIVEELKIPVRYIGFGEGLDDLRPFDAESFTDALFRKVVK